MPPVHGAFYGAARARRRAINDFVIAVARFRDVRSALKDYLNIAKVETLVIGALVEGRRELEWECSRACVKLNWQTLADFGVPSTSHMFPRPCRAVEAHFWRKDVRLGMCLPCTFTCPIVTCHFLETLNAINFYDGRLPIPRVYGPAVVIPVIMYNKERRT
jgi:hypothetical protein